MPINFSEEQILKRMDFENPWWETKKIDPFYNKMKRRAYFNLFQPLVEERSIKRAVVLMGPRRVGKTVMIYHSIARLIEQKVNAKNSCFISIETPIFNGIGLDELVQLFLKHKNVDKSEESYIFFDEIQYLKDWEVHLKTLVDSYHNIKFIVSGSAAAALKLKSRESGAGRFTDFMLPPLSFYEYLMLTEHKDRANDLLFLNFSEEKSELLQSLNEKFLNYINFGGYPELSLSETLQTNPQRYIRNDIIDKVLMRDLPSLYGINDIQELNSLFTYLAYNSGNEVSYETISKSSGVSKNTIRKYIEYLEAAFLIKTVHRIDQSGKRFLRTNFFKVYLTNPSLRSALFFPITASDEFMGNMVETAIFSQWQHSTEQNLYYARWKSGEVDLVHFDDKLQKPDWCVEIKWSNRFVKKPHELNNLVSFCKKQDLDSAMVTTIDKFENSNLNEISLAFVPASLYCLSVGTNAVLSKFADAL